MRSDYTRKLFFGLTLLGLGYAGWQFVKLPPEVEADACECSSPVECEFGQDCSFRCGSYGDCVTPC